MNDVSLSDDILRVDKRRPRQSRAIATRTALVAAGRDCFGRLGFHQIGTPELVERAAVTRGALYHHFASKADLFEVVAHDVAEDLRDRTHQRVMEHPGSVLDMLVQGMKIYLDNVAADREIQRILLIDGPAVLGWDRLREIYAAILLPGIITSLTMLDNPAINEVLVENIARLLLSSLNGAALHIAHADDPVSASREQGAALEFLLSGLRQAHQQS